MRYLLALVLMPSTAYGLSISPVRLSSSPLAPSYARARAPDSCADLFPAKKYNEGAMYQLSDFAQGNCSAFRKGVCPEIIRGFSIQKLVHSNQTIPGELDLFDKKGARWDRSEFNAAIEKAPASLSKAFDGRVAYVVTMRHWPGLCAALGSQEEGAVNASSYYDGGRWDLGMHANPVVFLDENLCYLGNAKVMLYNLVSGTEWGPYWGDDIKLKMMGSDLWMSSMNNMGVGGYYHGKSLPTWEHKNTNFFVKLHFEVQDSNTHNVSVFIHPDDKVAKLVRNGAFIESASGKYYLLNWVEPLDVQEVQFDHTQSWHRVNDAKEAEAKGERKTLTEEAGDLKSLGRTSADASFETTQRLKIHNNVHPIRIPGTRELLGVAHWHRSPDDQKRIRTEKYGILAKHSNHMNSHYTHIFFTMNDEEPFEVKRQSHEFCMSSPQNENDCEVIQFVQGLTFKTGSNDTLLMSYGVNDCESRVIDIKLEKILSMLK